MSKVDETKEPISCVRIDYESEYYRQEEYIKKLYTENEKYKKALLNLITKIFGDDN